MGVDMQPVATGSLCDISQFSGEGLQMVPPPVVGFARISDAASTPYTPPQLRSEVVVVVRMEGGREITNTFMANVLA